MDFELTEKSCSSLAVPIDSDHLRHTCLEAIDGLLDTVGNAVDAVGVPIR